MQALHRDFVGSDFLEKAGNIEAGRFAQDVLRALPPQFFGPVKSRFFRAADEQGAAAANSYISQVKAELCAGALSLSSSDSEICEFAVQRANEVRSLLMAMTAGTAADTRATLAGYCVEFGAVVPPGVLLAGLVARMTDAAWWRRQVRRSMARKVEAHAIGLGFVHRRAGLYASDEAVKRHAEQSARNAAALEATEATNEEGLTMTLAQLSAVGVSNPAIRRMELMTRISGFEGCAKAAGHVGMFYTATAPSRMHARMSKTGQENPKYDGTTPKECAGYMSKTWAKARAWLHRRGINIYGFRVAEPHHDGTPHWHMLFFMLADAVESVTYCLRRYFCENDAHELEANKAMDARFNAKTIDWKRGSAAGYISKYIAKNIDGARNDQGCIGQVFDDTEDGNQIEVADSARETAPRVLAWASTWGIRQFQQIGGPGVTVWRELRRVRDAVQGDLFDAWSAASVAGDWHAFTETQGGAVCKRKERPLQLWKETEPGKLTKYAEEAGPQIKGVFMNRPTAGESLLKTRIHTWEIRSKSNVCNSSAGVVGRAVVDVAFGGGVGSVGVGISGRAGESNKGDRGEARRVLGLGAKRPWSPVNNCTPPEKDADGFKVGGFAGQASPPEISADMREKIKAAAVAAVLDGIRAKRQRGAFGQFPKLGFQRGQGGQSNANSNQ